jgi:uncharacterized protein YidB (DUF937 family)
MGLLDVLNGMQNGPRGQVDPNAARGMSPITMAVLGLLAYKALKNFGANRPAQTSPIPGGAGMPGRGGGAMPGSGALGGLLGGLGGLLAGGAAGSALSGGLADLVRRFEQAGHGDVAHSWVGPGGNQPIAPNTLAEALGADRIDALTAQTGLSRDELLDGLSRELPGAVDELTPEGRLPTEQEMSQRV